MVKEDADGNNQARPHTWCDKVPKEICAPDYCQMIPGAYEAISEIFCCKIKIITFSGNQDCQEVTIQSTQVAPKEMCDLQPTSDCHMETNMVPFLVSVQNCADVPKEFCHMRMGEPKRGRYKLQNTYQRLFTFFNFILANFKAYQKFFFYKNSTTQN